eukprot:Pgem_evm2s15695
MEKLDLSENYFNSLTTLKGVVYYLSKRVNSQKGLVNLETLILDNMDTDVPSELFHGLNKLKNLSMKDLLLNSTFLAKGIFDDLTSLEKLNIADSALSSLPRSIKKLVNLKTLEFDAYVNNMHEEVFKFLEKMVDDGKDVKIAYGNPNKLIKGNVKDFLNNLNNGCNDVDGTEVNGLCDSDENCVTSTINPKLYKCVTKPRQQTTGKPTGKQPGKPTGKQPGKPTGKQPGKPTGTTGTTTTTTTSTNDSNSTRVSIVMMMIAV